MPCKLIPGGMNHRGLVLLNGPITIGFTILNSSGFLSKNQLPWEHGFGVRSLVGGGPVKTYGHTYGQTLRRDGYIILVIKRVPLHFGITQIANT